MSEAGGGNVPVSTDVLQEIVTVAGDPSLTLDALGQECSLLYQLAEQKNDQESVALVTTVWDKVVALSEQAGHAINIATAAREIAQTLQTQRDAALQAHEELLEAIDDIDLSVPEVENLVQIVEEGYSDMLWENGCYVSECPACDMIDAAEIPVSHPIADAFHDILCGSRYGEVSADILKEIADFMCYIVKKVDGEDSGE